MTPLARPPTCSATCSSCAGLWQRTMRSARSASSPLPASASPPDSAASASARSVRTSVHSTGSPHPRASARAMLPLPTRPIIGRGVYGERRSAPRQRLVEEALLDEPRALLRRDLDVARGEHEDLVGDLLHAAVEGVGEAGGEVDEALRQIRVGALEVEDHRDRVLEAVGDLLGVVERLGDDEVHADVAAVARAGRAAEPPTGRRTAVGRPAGSSSAKMSSKSSRRRRVERRRTLGRSR